MHPSLGVFELMPFGQSYAGLESLSVYRASVVQRMRTSSPAQYGWLDDHLLVFHLQRRGGEFAVKQGEFFAEQRRDCIVPNRNGDTTGGLDRVGAAASA
jgi:hypothetical protein